MNAIAKIVRSFRLPNIIGLELVMPATRGFDSVAPKYRIPIMVVAKSSKPSRIRVKKKKSPLFNISSSSLLAYRSDSSADGLRVLNVDSS